jgi:hypothetical protein
MGVVQKLIMKSYFSRDPVIETPVFSQAMNWTDNGIFAFYWW